MPWSSGRTNPVTERRARHSGRLSGRGSCPAPLPFGIPRSQPCTRGSGLAVPGIPQPAPGQAEQGREGSEAAAAARRRAGRGRRELGHGGRSAAGLGGGSQPPSLPPSPSITTLPITTPSITSPIISKSAPPLSLPSPSNPRKGHVKAGLRFWGDIFQLCTDPHSQAFPDVVTPRSPPGILSVGWQMSPENLHISPLEMQMSHFQTTPPIPKTEWAIAEELRREVGRMAGRQL